MLATRRPARSVAVLLSAVPMTAAMVLATAGPALASATWNSPNAGQVFSSGSAVNLSVSVSANLTAGTDLHLSGPGFADKVVDSAPAGAGTTLTYSLSTAGRRNGTWTASLSGGNTGTRSFFLNYAPAVPAGFSAQGSGARDVTFSWTKGNEPDLNGYTLTADDGTVIDGGITTSACSGSSCSYALYYPSDNPGTHGYRLLARRASGGCSSCGSELSSGPATASATLTLPPPPPPSPTPSPTASPSSAPTSGGTSTGSPTGGPTPGATPGGSSAGSPSPSSSPTGSSTGGFQAGPKPTLGADQLLASRQKFALRFNAFAPSLGIPKLPPLPALELPVAGAEGPLPTGTYNPTLPYAATTTSDKVQDKGGFGHPIAAVQSLDTEQLSKSLAGALILLLLGAHIRRFVGSHVSED